MSIKLKSQRGSIGSSFLANQFRDYAEKTLGPSTRAAGKRLARAGAIEWLDVSPGVVNSALTFDGEVFEPQLSLGPWRGSDIEALREFLAKVPSVLTEFVAGAHNANNEALLSQHYVPLLPGDLATLSFACTCLAWPRVCEHIYALLYAVVELFDEQPEQYLHLLGIEIEGLLSSDLVAEETSKLGADAVQDTEIDSVTEQERPKAGELETSGANPAARFSPAKLNFAQLATQLDDELGPQIAQVLGAFYAAAETEPETQIDNNKE